MRKKGHTDTLYILSTHTSAHGGEASGGEGGGGNVRNDVVTVHFAQQTGYGP